MSSSPARSDDSDATQPAMDVDYEPAKLAPPRRRRPVRYEPTELVDVKVPVQYALRYEPTEPVLPDGTTRRRLRYEPTEIILSLHSLPAEIIERVLLFSGPRDVSRYSQTCRFAFNLVYASQDQYLWRELYLRRPYDDLRKAATTPRGVGRFASPPVFDTRNAHQGENDIPWQWEVQRRTFAEFVAASDIDDVPVLESTYEAFLAAIETAAPVEPNEPKPAGAKGGDGDLQTRSENLRWLDRLLRKTRVLDRIPVYFDVVPVTISYEIDPSLMRMQQCPPNVTAIDAYDEHGQRLGLQPAEGRSWTPPGYHKANQMRAQLRAYVALSHENDWDTSVASKERMARIRRESRAYVYDMRKYQTNTLWGPYRVAGEDKMTVLVNWEHVEHILNVVGLKLRETDNAWLGFYKKPLFKMEALRAYSAVGSFERPDGDWAGVTGTWRRFVCFMDYRDLYMFNYSLLPPGPRDPNFFDDNFDEALRPVELELALISHNEYYSDRHYIAHDPSGHTPGFEPRHKRAPYGDVKDPAFPTLYFKGTSRGNAHSADATIRGKVSVLSDGAVRWLFVTTYDGRKQWSAEGVQLGHVCSAAGVAGIWTGASHDRDDPAGPFWMIKVNDELPQGVLNTLH